MALDTIVEGDGLDFLTAIEPGTAALIYLDAPWFSGRKDKVAARRAYLEWMEDVFECSRDVLSEAGTLVVHPDPQFMGGLRAVLEELFGYENFRGEVVVPRRLNPSSSQTLTRAHDTFLFFSKSDNAIYTHVYRRADPQKQALGFDYIDEHGPYRLVDATVALDRPQLRFEWKGQLPPAGRSWRFNTERMRLLESEGRLHYVKGRPARMKQYASEVREKEVGSVWDDLTVAAPRKESLGWPGQQSIELLRRIVEMTTAPADVIVDPFCGSGTALLAAATNGRRWLGCDESPGACWLAFQRLIRAGVSGMRTEKAISAGGAASRRRSGARPLAPGDGYDVFISYAHEDREIIARPLARALRGMGLHVWYDEIELKLGDSVRESIDRGLSKSHFGVVVLSPAFFTKRWTQYELNGLVGREMAGKKVILPIWHEVTHEQVLEYSPAFADKVARMTSAATIEEIAREIAEVVAAGR